MKKLSKVMILASALTLTFSAGVFAATDIKLYVEGNKTNIQVEIIDGSSYVPLKAVGELLGKEVKWEEATRSIYISDKTQSTISEGEYQADNLSFYDLNVVKGKLGWEIVAEVRNDGAKELKNAVFTAVFYNGNGKRVGTAQGSLLDLSPKENHTVKLETADDLTGYKSVKFQLDKTN
ncbi:FxLYD domain-containing protein [Paenibacillus sedimenti]|uniref:Copper amine oxidase-like N-terminal domain-containing protein n=1 Tax=Paenibacillus sedimenti TaxID=2770274 RepID=A0A926KMK0_9BACL|nr:stalk domain-containing protein [Paenibacillus sedimenti]MBD0379756.1 hypothetical protein [Paenibacillus sedimenti]